METEAGQKDIHKESETYQNKEAIRQRRCYLCSGLVFVALILLIVFSILYANGSFDGSDDSSSNDGKSNDDINYFPMVNFPKSDHFKIESYIDPTNTSSSIILKPRAMRSAVYDGATLVYVGSSDWKTDRAYVLIDYESDGINDAEFIIFESSSVSSTYSPASLALSFDGNNDLYISLTDQLIKCDGNVHEKVLAFKNSTTDRLSGCKKIMDIPTTAEDASKSWNVRRYIGISKKTNTLCMANGVTCDDCAHESADLSFPHGTITCFNDLSESAMGNTNMSNANDANINVIADGVRNSVGFDWHPVSDGFYFTDNGRDEVHEHYPDDELNFVDGNNHFGFPWCHSLGSGEIELRDIDCTQSFIDPNISNPSSIDCSIYENSFQALGPHVVPLGVRFYSGTMFPTDFQNSLFIAQRGSGDSDSFGYRVSAVKLSADGKSVIDHEIFADGWYDYDTSTIYGRPVDVEVLNDGSLLISDDHSNQIYRVTYTKPDDDETFFDSTAEQSVCDYSYVETNAPTSNPTQAPTFYLDLPFEINIAPDNFDISYYVHPSDTIVKQPRAMRSAFYNGSTLVYVGSKQWNADRAYVLIDYESDGINDAEFVIFEASSVSSSYSPASLALSFDGNNDLYISLTDQLIKCDGNVHEKVLAFKNSTDRLSGCKKIMDIPTTAEDASKSWNVRRYIGISKKTNTLCMANGVTCDDCAHESADLSFPHGTITCFNDLSESAMGNTNMSNANDANINVIADGVRNSVGFDWHPVSDGFYFTDNGRDEVHEHYPDDELNFVDGNNHFGFPWCHSLGSGEIELRDIDCTQSFIDPNISNPSSVDCSIYENSFQALGPHVVPLGVRFYSGTMFPTDFQNSLFIAQRGSGDSDSFGYRVSAVKLSADGKSVIDHEIFADGWYDYDTSTIHGRPVDVEVLNDGSLLISDDHGNGAIYRVTYNADVSDIFFAATNDSAICDYSYVNE